MFGKINKITILADKRTARVNFDDALNSVLASLSLNGRFLPKDQAYLIVKIVRDESSSSNCQSKF